MMSPGAWKFWNDPLYGRDFLVGEINVNKFSLILPNSSMGVAPYRRFCGEFKRDADNKIIITGKFKQPTRFFALPSIIFIILTILFISNPMRDFGGFIWISFCFLILLGIGWLFGVKGGKKFEDATIEFIEKILAEG